MWSGNTRMIPTRGNLNVATGPSGMNQGLDAKNNPKVSRSYQASPGQTIDAIEADSSMLASQGFVSICASGPTASRPNNAYLTPGFLYLDTDIGLIVAWDTSAWRNPVTGAVA